MEDESGKDSFESRLGRALDSIDEASKKLEGSIKEKLDRKKESKDSVSIGEDGVSESSNSETFMERTRGGAGKIGSSVSTSVQNANIGEKASGVGIWMKRTGQSTGSGLKTVGSHLPYIIPATVIFQTALWMAYLTEGSVSHDLVSSMVEGLGETGQDVAILISIFGLMGAKLISLDFNSNQAFDAFSLHSGVVDVMVVLLVLSSVLYLLKRFQSLYYLSLVFIGSFVLRIGSVEGYSYDWTVVVCSAIGLIGLFFAISLPLYKNRVNQNKKDSEIDTSLLIDSVDDSAESSYLKAGVGDFDMNRLGRYQQKSRLRNNYQPNQQSLPHQVI